MDNLVKVKWFGIIWYQEWLPKKFAAELLVSLWIHPFFYDFLMYLLIFMNMQTWSLAYFTAEWSGYVLLLFFIELVL